MVPPVTPTPPVPPPPVIVVTDFASFALTPNQRAAANLLDAVELDPRAATFIKFLNSEPFSALPGDFNKISPDGLTSFYEIGFSTANLQRLTLEDRLDQIRQGSRGFSSNMRSQTLPVLNLDGKEFRGRKNDQRGASP